MKILYYILPSLNIAFTLLVISICMKELFKAVTRGEIRMNGTISTWRESPIRFCISIVVAIVFSSIAGWRLIETIRILSSNN